SLVRIGNNISQIVSTDDNTDDFHTFRIMQLADSGLITVWRDGVELYSGLSNTVNSGSEVTLFMGDGGTGWGGPSIMLDYFRWDSTGGYEPVPEPCSFVLAGIGVIGAIGCSHRRRRSGARTS